MLSGFGTDLAPLLATVDGKTWDRRADESDRDYSLFRSYLHAPAPRTVKGVASDAGMPWAQVSSICYRHAWLERARAYDASLWAVHDQVVEETIAARAARHARAARRLFDVASTSLSRAERDLAGSDVAPLPLRDAARLLASAVELERGLEPVSGQGAALDAEALARLSLEELEALRALLAKAKG